jgi:tetratricopeptide (TPR) repeat protein
MQTHPTEELKSILHQAQRFNQFGEYVAARDLLKTAVKNTPSFSEGWFVLGNTHERLSDFQSARECFITASDLKPDWLDPIVSLGHLEFNQKRYKEAASVLKKYLKLEGSSTDVLLLLAQSAFNIDDCKTVLAATSRIIDIDEGISQAWELRGLCHAKLSNISSACVALNMALELNPSSIDSLNAVGNLCYASQNYTGAVDCYGPSLTKQEMQPLIMFRYGTSLWFLERWTEAIEVLTDYTKIAPDDPAGWNNLGVALREKGEVVRARECYKKALHINPNLAEPKENLETATNKQVIS